jgi:hypothetical protein
MDGSNTPTLVLQNNPNGCTGTGVGLSKLIWTCQASGTYYLESAPGNLAYWGVNASQTVVLNYKTLPSFSFANSVCPDVFYDKGNDGTDGAFYNYNNNEDWIYTIYPPDTLIQAATVQFISFSTAPGDVLCVYDGSSLNAPIIGCYSGPSITGMFTSSAMNGALTFHFTSDDSIVSSGWNSNVCYVLRDIGITNHSLAGHIKIYPNPVKEDQFTVSGLEFTVNGNLKIYSTIGELVYSTVINDKQETVNSKLPAGIYFVRIESEKESWNGKFVKQ